MKWNKVAHFAQELSKLSTYYQELCSEDEELTEAHENLELVIERILDRVQEAKEQELRDKREKGK